MTQLRQRVDFIVLFLLCLIVRIAFKYFSGYDNFELFGDSGRYDILSRRIINGEANMDIVAYLSAPLYSYTLALFKTIHFDHWQTITVSYHFLLISLSAIYIYKITDLLFKSRSTSFIASLIYIFYPMTLWFNFTIAQETTFQAFIIIFSYYFMASSEHGSKKNYMLTSLSFGLALLTKSHILMLLPFLLLIKMIHGQLLDFSKYLVIIVGLMILPHGLINKQQHGVFTISSHGNASFFLLGHSDFTYDCILNTSGSTGQFSHEGCVPVFVFDRDQVFPKYGKANALSVKERNRVRLKIALEWVKQNPSKFLKLKIYGIQRFLMPGLDYKQFKLKYWLASFIAGILIYIPGYLILYQQLMANYKDHLLMVSLILVTAAIFIIFFPVNRFRVITMEPLLIVYAGQWYSQLISKLTGVR